MPDSAAPKVAIGTLKLRVPGESAAQGRGLAQELGAALAERIPAHLAGHIPALKIRVTGGSSGARLTEDMVQGIVRALERRQFHAHK